MSEAGMRKGLLVIMFVGAANADATQEQRARLRDEALPLLKDEGTPPGEAMANTILKTAEIMGSEWRPAGEWDAWITSLLGER